MHCVGLERVVATSVIHHCSCEPMDAGSQLDNPNALASRFLHAVAVYDLVGALFAPNEPMPSRHADKLFIPVRSVIKDGFADPDFGPCETAATAGISLRYLQKMFLHNAARPTVNSSIRSV
jgi:hypothetical protein